MTNAITIETRTGNLTIDLTPRGYRSRTNNGMTTWCDEDQRDALAKALSDSEQLGKKLTRAQIADTLRKLGKWSNPTGERKHCMVTQLMNALIDCWMPYRDC